MSNKPLLYHVRPILFLSLISLTVIQTSCKKYLDKKPQEKLAVPSSLKDFQALLDNNDNNANSPGYLEFVADNFFLQSSSWNGAAVEEHSSYIWSSDARVNNYIWNNPYITIYNANFVLDYLAKITIKESDRDEYNNIMGEALFYRAFMFHQLAQLFCRPYSNSATTDLGIVLRLTSAIEAKSTRSTVQQTYDKVIADLKAAADILPVTSAFSTRPNKAAAYAELARVYLSMRDYANAGTYADAALAINSTLLNYDSLTSGLPAFTSNPEILFLSNSNSFPGNLLGPFGQGFVDTFLYQTYDVNDLRRTIFFGSNTGSHYWHGSYFTFSGPYSLFDGLATDEIYLIRAECKARAGNINAMDDLNTLLRKRYKINQFSNLTANSPSDALNKILIERRKELLFRGLRWSDLRRLNLENANITLTRMISGVTYTLPPNDLRWVLLIPDAEISRSGISQNPR
jgi:tetratricopeptide (TPR) repeat protein